MKTIIIVTTVVISVLLVVIGGVALLNSRSNSNTVNTGTKVRLYTVQPVELIEFVSAPGDVAPQTKVDISARVSARIAELPFDEGDTVTKGNPDSQPPVPPSLLIKLDDTDLQAALLAAQARKAAQLAQIEVEAERIAAQHARIAQSRAWLDKAERDLKRQQQLLASKDVSQSSVDAMLSDVESKKAELDAAEHSLAASTQSLKVLKHNLEADEAEIIRAQDRLSYATITSPIDGVITRLNAEVGELVMTGTMNNPGTVILQVADLSNMVVNVRVDEADIAPVEVGQSAAVRIHAYPDHVFRGTVTKVALAVTNTRGEKSFETEILLDKSDLNIRSGLTADVDIEIQKHEGILAVPSQAVLSRNTDNLPLEIRENNDEVDANKTYTTVVYRFIDGKTVVTPVIIGPSDATHTLIKSGINPEDQIIIGPYKTLESINHDQNVKDEKAANKDEVKEETEDAEEQKEEDRVAGAEQNDAPDDK